MQKHNKIHKQRGFTLIELLVVIAIIGLLASIVLVSLNTARTKARDVRRKADLKQIQLALEMYADDNNGAYPVVPGWALSTSGGEWIPGLGKYMSKIPVDPKNNAAYPWATGNYSYAYGYNTATYSGYDLVAQLENTSDNDRCEKQCWKIHTWSLGTPWYAGCGSGSASYSPYLYADH